MLTLASGTHRLPRSLQEQPGQAAAYPHTPTVLASSPWLSGFALPEPWAKGQGPDESRASLSLSPLGLHPSSSSGDAQLPSAPLSSSLSWLGKKGRPGLGAGGWARWWMGLSAPWGLCFPELYLDESKQFYRELGFRR